MTTKSESHQNYFLDAWACFQAQFYVFFRFPDSNRCKNLSGVAKSRLRDMDGIVISTAFPRFSSLALGSEALWRSRADLAVREFFLSYQLSPVSDWNTIPGRCERPRPTNEAIRIKSCQIPKWNFPFFVIQWGTLILNWIQNVCSIRLLGIAFFCRKWFYSRYL